LQRRGQHRGRLDGVYRRPAERERKLLGRPAVLRAPGYGELLPPE